MFLNAVGVFSFLPTAFDPGFVSRVSRSSTLGLGLLCVAWAVSLAVEFWRAATRSWTPVFCLATGRVLAGSMTVTTPFSAIRPWFSKSFVCKCLADRKRACREGPKWPVVQT